MRHAGPDALDRLEPLLAEVRRRRPDLRERSRGVFYEKGRAFLHFHEDAKGLFADMRCAGAWGRFDVTGAEGREAVLRWAGEGTRTRGRGPPVHFRSDAPSGSRRRTPRR